MVIDDPIKPDVECRLNRGNQDVPERSNKHCAHFMSTGWIWTYDFTLTSPKTISFIFGPEFGGGFGIYVNGAYEDDY